MKKFNENAKGLLFFGIITLIYVFAPLLLFGSNCLFKMSTGIPCPGCGMTRAYMCLIRGDLGGAFFNHPLFWTVPIICAIWIYPFFKGDKIDNRMIYGFAILFMVVYLVRMIVYFPDTPPMDYSGAAWSRLFEL